MRKKIFVILVLAAAISIVVYLKFFEKEKIPEQKISEKTESYKSNILENIEYISKEANGNEYLIAIFIKPLLVSLLTISK